MSSTFTCPIIRVHLEPHPNADTLSLVRYEGYQVVVKTSEFTEGQLAAWIPPDSVVPDTPEWAWLQGRRRIKVHKFRGEWSHGVLLAAGSWWQLPGEDVAAALGVVAYEPPSASNEGRSSGGGKPRTLWQKIREYFLELRNRPRGRYPYYDVEHLRRSPNLIQPEEDVIITEKIHGANALYICRKPWIGKARIFMRSRTMWKKVGESSWWNAALINSPNLSRFLRLHPGLAVYGEVYGQGIQELTYGRGAPHFVAFDIWDGTSWMQKDLALDLLMKYNVPIVPILWQGPYPGLEVATKMADKDSIQALYEGKKQVSEGVVVSSVKHRKTLKIVSDRYLEKSKE